MSLRSFLYMLARIMGDVRAVRRGPRAIGTRIVRRALFRTLGREINRIR